MKYLKDQTGAALVIELVLVALVLVGVGLAVYTSLHHSNSATSKSSPSASPQASASASPQLACANPYTDAKGLYKLCPPTGWHVATSPLGSGAFALALAEQTSSDLAPAGQSGIVTVEVYNANPSLQSFKQGEASEASANGITITDKTINGQPAFLETQSGNGFQTQRYYVGKGTHIVGVTMLVQAGGANPINNTQYLDAFNSVAQSVTVLN